VNREPIPDGEPPKAAMASVGEHDVLVVIEPFGLVMIDAMSAGTPVIAWPNGSVSEVIADGVGGRIVDSIEAAAGS
jgi:glycosyltransferase involved in cell wall biosynthesis